MMRAWIPSPLPQPQTGNIFVLHRIKSFIKSVLPGIEGKWFSPYAKLFADISPADICIDCGANVGRITLKMAKKGATVYAFEPNPFAFKVLAQKTKAFPKICAYNKAAYHADARVKLYFHQKHQENPVLWSTGSSLLAEKTNVNQSQYHEVEAVNLSRFIKELGAPVHILKIDIEGAEYDLVNALIDSGALSNVRHVLVETHAHKIPSLQPADKNLRAKIKALNLESKIDLDWV
ncbi:MAG: FkbM family methyltransferase [Bdellovibrionales bacterium]